MIVQSMSSIAPLPLSNIGKIEVLSDTSWNHHTW
jgi:hypothetical protein